MSDSAIREAVRQLAGTHLADEVYLIPCNVISVDEPSRTCDCVAIGGVAVTEIPSVKLMADVDDGMLMIPAVDSTVLVVFSKRNEPYVSMYSQLDKILMIVGDSIVEIKDGSLKINDGSFGGLIKIDELVKKVNKLEKDINNLKSAFFNWTPVPNDGGAALKAASATWASQTLIPTKKSELENTLVNHGK